MRIYYYKFLLLFSDCTNEWIQIYFKKVDDACFQCNICRSFVKIEKLNNEDLIDHLRSDHKAVYDLHKNALSDETIGYRIEFLNLEDITIKTDKSPKVLKTLKIVRHLPDLDKERADEYETSTPVVHKRSKGGQDGKKRSWVWKYFEKINSIIHRCTICNVVLSIKGLNTNNLNRHVRSKHPGVYKSETSKKLAEHITDIGSEVEISNIKRYEELNESGQSVVKFVDGVIDDDAPKPRRSWIWEYFEPLSDTLAQCKLCHRKICHGSNATGNINRHMKMLHKDIYINYVFIVDHEEVKTCNEDVSWIWKLFAADDDNLLSCKICNYKCMKFADMSKSTHCILRHLKTAHGVVSGDQIITGTDCEANLIDECSTAVDFLKGAEVI